MGIDEKTQAHIIGLEAQLEDAYVKIDLLEEALLDSENGRRAAIKQVEVERQHRKVDYQVG